MATATDASAFEMPVFATLFVMIIAILSDNMRMAQLSSLLFITSCLCTLCFYAIRVTATPPTHTCQCACKEEEQDEDEDEEDVEDEEDEEEDEERFGTKALTVCMCLVRGNNQLTSE